MHAFKNSYTKSETLKELAYFGRLPSCPCLPCLNWAPTATRHWDGISLSILMQTNLGEREEVSTDRMATDRNGPVPENVKVQR